ncbi:MAG: esterase-like activity of phytase family protein [Pseudomonadota bacterium]
MKRARALLALAAAPLLAGGATSPEAFDVELAADAGLAFRGAVEATSPDEDFGGLSGALFQDGALLSVSDRAGWARIDLNIEGGRLTGVNGVEMAAMLDASGDPAEGDGWDAEGLARAPDGDLLVSFEGDHRIQRFADPLAKAGAEIRPAAWERFSGNSGLEALAVDETGRIWAIRERSGATDRPFPVFVGETNGEWREKSLPRDGDFLPTGADFGPDGALWIVERAFSLLGGFRTRIRRTVWDDGDAPVISEVMATFSASDGLDNLEGIDLWREDGETRLLLISDDNFFFLQRTIIAMFAVKDG